MKNILLTTLFLLTVISSAFAQIDRKTVLERNNPHVTKADALASLSVGNGHFATTVDVTGMQSFPEYFFDGVPLCAMSDWGWHFFPNTENLTPEETQRKMNLGHGRDEVFAVEYKTEGRNKNATEYFRVNPHRLNLGNVGLVFDNGKSAADISVIKDVDQTLSLYDGKIVSNYSAMGEKVSVVTAALADRSAMIYSLKSKLFNKKKAQVVLTLPYVTGKHADAATDFSAANFDKHASRVVAKSGNSVVIEHKLDASIYYIKVSWKGGAKFVALPAAHSYSLCPTSENFSLKVEYAESQAALHKTFNFQKELLAVADFWHGWWNKGAFVDFSECTDARAKELERRVVLSQYLTYINCANQTPPQETGLTYNSWFGRPHLEMTWWHMVDFSLWNRPEVMETILEWYNNEAYPEAKKIAQRQNFKGIRWMKMTDPWVGESPSNVGSFLTWQQPHYIYMAEEMYRHNPTAATLEKYAKYVEETAEFMEDFALACQKDKNGVIKLHGQTAAQESMSKDFSYNHPFEQVYWVYGLTTANKWRERRGLARNSVWDDIIRRMGPLPAHEGIYTAGEPTQAFADAATGATDFDPFNYGGDSGKKQLSSEEFYLKCRSDHPAVLGACGMLPYYGQYDRAQMQRTLDFVMNNWNWDTTWGWDYGMTAMCAARLGDGENAVKALLIDKGKNTYLVSGHNYQEPKRLRLYLPGNGSLLDAVAMMCAGWDGCDENVKNPGFPQNGKWNVKWEGLKKMQ